MASQNTDIKSKVFSGLIWKFSERMLAQLVTFVVSIVLARLLTPEDYGAIALIMVFITIANVFVTNGFGSALIQKQNVDDVDFSTVLYFNVLFGIAIYFVMYMLAPIIATFYNNAQLCPVFRVLGLRIPVAAINSVQQAYVSRKMLFKRFFLSTLFGTVISGVVGIVLAYRGFGLWSLAAQYLTNTTISTIVLWFTMDWRPIVAFSFRRMKTLFSYGWKLLCSGLLDTGYTQLQSLIIGKVYNSESLAYYNRGDQFPNILAVNTNASISSVLFPAISKVQDNVSQVRAITRRAIKISSYVMFPIMTGLASIAAPLIEIMLTEKWLACVPYMQILCLSYALWPIHTANLEAMKALGRSDLFLKLECIKKGIGIAILVLVLSKGPLAIAIGTLLTSVVATFINSFPNRKLLQYTFFEQMRDIMPAIVLSGAMAVGLHIVQYFIKNIYLLLVIQVLCGIIIYVALSVLFHVDSFEYMMQFIKNRVKK